MIRERLALLEQAAAVAIELMRTASHPEQIALACIERLARAASCEWAAYWLLAPELQRIHRIAMWNTFGLKIGRLGRGTQRPVVSLSESNAAHVWRTRKPLWATSPLLAAGLPGRREGVEGELQGGMWFAVKTDTAVYGIIELMGRAFFPRSAADFATVERVGSRLGHVLEERRRDSPPQLH